MHRPPLLCALALLLSFLPMAQAQDQRSSWKTTRLTDEMSGQVADAVVKSFGASGGGTFQVTAKCAFGIVNFAFDYFGRGSSRGGSLAWQESENYTGTTFGFSTMVTKSVNRWVPLRIRIDQGEVVTRRSSSNFQNEAEIVFYDPAEVKRQQGLHKFESIIRPGQQLSAADKQKYAESLAFSDLYGVLYVTAAGTMTQLVNANAVKVEIPLQDGRTPIVTFNPSEDGLRAFLQGCSNLGGGGAPVTNRARPDVTAHVDGTYSDGKGTTAILSNGQAVLTLPFERPKPPLPYRVSGNQVLITRPDNSTAQLFVNEDGSLSSRDAAIVLRRIK